jgi:branched-chain amino acid transport system permease protein
MIRGAGSVSLAQGALLGIGAYSIGIGCVKFGLPFWLAFILGIIFSIFASLVLAHFSLRLFGDYLVISTLSFQLVLHEVALNFHQWTNGPMGIPNIPRPEILGFSLKSDLSLLSFSLICASLALWSLSVLWNSPYGKTLIAVRENPTIAMATGNNVERAKIEACAYGAIWAAIGGVILVSITRFVDPSFFGLGESLLILAVVVLAGNRPVPGILWGVSITVIAPELLRFVDFSAPTIGYARGICYGVILIITARSSLFSGRG